MIPNPRRWMKTVKKRVMRDPALVVAGFPAGGIEGF